MKRLFPITFCLLLLGCSRTPSQIRVLNLTGHDLAEVVVNTNSFGAIKAAAASSYQTIAVVFKRASIYTREADGHFRNYRFMGGANPSLRSGSYTYVLSIGTNDALEFKLQNDQ